MAYTALKNAVLREKIDWIAYTQASNTSWDFPPYIEDKWKDIPKLPHYTNGQENTQGVKRYWNTENMKQGKYIVLGGVASDTIADNQLDFLHGVLTSGKKPTRIDFALDITHSRLRPETVVKFLESGDVLTHARSIPKQSDSWNGGFTQYVGRKGSETYTRIYDKAIEQGTSFSWTRVETVYQGERARPAAKAYCEGASVRQLIRRHVDFPTWQDWKRIMVLPAAKLDIKTSETNTRLWLLSTVAKSIAKELVLDDSHDFWFRMLERIRCEIELLEIECPIIDF